MQYLVKIVVIKYRLLLLMFTFKNYRRSQHNKYLKKKQPPSSKRVIATNNTVNSDRMLPITGNPYYDTKFIKRSTNFYKSRRNRKVLNKTVRFSENLEQKFTFIRDEDIINDTSVSTQEKSPEAWDISLDFEELT